MSEIKPLPFVKYVLGFLFTEDRQQLVLIRKNKPEWQDRKWNGVGGKIESGETPLEAMCREFEEETGVTSLPHDWTAECTLKAPNNVVFVFSAFSNVAMRVKSKTIEPVELQRVAYLPGRVDLVSNLHYLIPMCLYSDHLKGTVINYPQ